MKRTFILTLVFSILCSIANAKMRTWVLEKGDSFSAEYIAVFGGKAVLKLKSGKKVRIPMDELSQQDRSFIELKNPPKLKINFTKTTKQRKTPVQAESAEKHHPSPKIEFMTFFVSVKKTSSNPYPHKMTVEYFAFGNEINGNKKILLATEEQIFSFKNKEKEFVFQGKTVELMRYHIVIGSWEKGIHLPARGEKYGGFIVVVKDELGKVIAYKSSNKNLYRVLDNIKKLHPGCFFDPATGIRTYPTSPDHFPPPPWEKN
jgi:hypothetical protein